jgi:hypothetical protein
VFDIDIDTAEVFFVLESPNLLPRILALLSEETLQPHSLSGYRDEDGDELRLRVRVRALALCRDHDQNQKSTSPNLHYNILMS